MDDESIRCQGNDGKFLFEWNPALSTIGIVRKDISIHGALTRESASSITAAACVLVTNGGSAMACAMTANSMPPVTSSLWICRSTMKMAMRSPSWTPSLILLLLLKMSSTIRQSWISFSPVCRN